MHQSAVHTGTAAYVPNSIDGDQPFVATQGDGAYIPTPRVIEGTAVRAAPASFDDHFSQPSMFYRSMTPVEQAHIVEAYTFELGKIYEQAIKERVLGVLANIDADLCLSQVAGRDSDYSAPSGTPAIDTTPSPALSQVLTTPGARSPRRKIGVVADAGSDLTGIKRMRAAAEKLGASVLVVAPVGGVLKKGRTTLPIDRTNLTGTLHRVRRGRRRSGGTTPTGDIKLTVLLQEAYRHCKALAAWGDGEAILVGAGIDLDAPGVWVGESADKEFTSTLVATVGLHRAWDRAGLVMASAVAPGNARRNRAVRRRRSRRRRSRRRGPTAPAVQPRPWPDPRTLACRTNVVVGPANDL